MPKPSAVTFESVRDACYALLRDGQPTSFASVYAALGHKGGAKVVQRYIQQWRDETRGKLLVQRRSPSLPEDLVDQSDQLVEALWLRALAKADGAYETARGELAQQRSELDATVARVQAQLTTAEKTILQVQGDLQAERARVEDRDRQIDDLTLRLAEHSTLLRAAEATAQEQRETLASLTYTLSSERRHHEVELAAERERHEAALATVASRHVTDLAREREIAAGERQFLMRQTDEMREAARVQDSRLREQLEALKIAEANFRRQAADARDHASTLRGKLEMLEAEFGRQRESQAAAQGEAATLREQLRVSQQSLRQFEAEQKTEEQEPKNVTP